MKTIPLILMGLFLAGCSSTAHFVRSAPITSVKNRPENLLVFYSAESVNFDFTEIGRVYLTTTEFTSYNPARDIEKIKRLAAKQGADGVIIQEKNRFESSGAAFGAAAATQAHDVTEYFGIAIVKK